MNERKDKKPEDLIKELEGAEVTELDDKDLEGAAGGLSGDCNCRCGGSIDALAPADGDCNCGC
jgi:hypothetical protein